MAGMGTQTSPGGNIRTLFNRLNKLADKTFVFVSVLLLAINLTGCLFIIRAVPYTEIDWETYMIQLSTIFDDNQYDYRKIEGPTGPLVYPAGHVYVYGILRALTSNGTDIRRAQYMFALLHTSALAIMLYIYRQSKSRIPLSMVCLLFFSRRLMSLFVLRLFNDCVQAVVMYASLLNLSLNRWGIGCALYSLAVSIKMNALLYAPGLAVLLCQAVGFWRALFKYAIAICLPIQFLLALPFLRVDPMAYLARAVELTRVFMYKWSVNGAFLPEHIFTSSTLAIVLLAAHLTTLLLFAHYKWTLPDSYGLLGLLGSSLSPSFKKRTLRPTHVLLVLFTSNFVGIAFARTLHYQFYTWYVHSLPFLIWGGPLPFVLKIAVVLLVEVVFNVYPPHPFAALVLSTVHFSILFSLFTEKRPTPTSMYKNEDHQHQS